MGEQQIAMAATFTAEPVKKSLAFWTEKLGSAAQIDFAPYNQVFQQLLDAGSLLGKNQQGANVILLRLEDWQRYRDEKAAAATGALDAARLQSDIEELLRGIGECAARVRVPMVVALCPASPALLSDLKQAAILRQAEDALRSGLSGKAGIYFVGSGEACNAYAVGEYHDAYGDQLGHIPYTPEFFAALGTVVARKIHSLQRAPYKVIAVDCDETLWRGVCGEVGAEGIEIDGSRRSLQEFLIGQQQQGMLLCLCSKNDEEDVAQVFARRTDMPLGKQHIAAERINWRAKSENLRSLAKELNLGLDSFIFIDDNPVECAEVAANCPEVLVLELSRESNDVTSFLKNVWGFDRAHITDEDKKRTQLYQQDRERERAKQGATGLAEFIARPV